MRRKKTDFAVYDSKKSRFIKEQEGEGLLSNLGLKTPISKIPLLGNFLFSLRGINTLIQCVKLMK